MLAHIFVLILAILGGVALYSAGWSDGYRAGYRTAEADAAPVVYRPQPHTHHTKKGEPHGDENRLHRP